jgi:hypothetical protein
MDRVGGVSHFVTDRAGWHERQVRMRPRVVNDHVTGVGDLAGHARMGVDIDADHGERRGNPVPVQQPQDLRGVNGARAVVDCQRDRVRPVVDVVHRLFVRRRRVLPGRLSDGKAREYHQSAGPEQDPPGHAGAGFPGRP